MPKIRFTDIATGISQDADEALPIDATFLGSSEATIRPKVFNTAATASTIAPENLTSPRIEGALGVGQTLSLTGGVWDGANSFAYRWYSAGVLVATTATYEVQSSDQGNLITAEVQASTNGAPGPYVPASNTAFIPVVAFAVVDANEWDTYEAPEARKVFIRVNDVPTTLYEFCYSDTPAPASDVALVSLTQLTPTSSWFQNTTFDQAPVGTAANRTVRYIRIAERLLSDPTNTSLWRWVSDTKPVTISSVPSAPVFAVRQGTATGEIIANLTEKSDPSGQAVTSYEYQVDGSGAWLPVGGGLEIGDRSLLGFTALAVYSLSFRAVNINGVSLPTTPVSVVAGQPAVLPGATTTIVFGSQQIVIEGAYTIVTHIDGPKCIVSASPVTVQSKTPATSTTAGAIRNGAMKNPQRVYQAFDSRATQIDLSRLVAFPVSLAPNEILLSSVSTAEGSTTNSRDGFVDSYDMIYVSAVAPNPLSLAPATCGWPGRTTLTAGPVIDYDAKAALLPVTYAVPGITYATESRVDRALRFNPIYGITYKANTLAPEAGYERLFPFRYGSPSGWVLGEANSNYGQSVCNKLTQLMWQLVAPTSSISLAVKAKMMMRLCSFVWQTVQAWEGNNTTITSTGEGHFNVHQGPFALFHYLTENSAELDALKTKHGGVWRVFSYLTEAAIPEWFTPWGDADNLGLITTFPYPAEAYRRRILSIDPVAKSFTVPALTNVGDASRYGGGAKKRWTGLYVTVESSPTIRAKVVGPDLDWPKGYSTPWTMYVDTWPTPGFTVGDIVTAQPPWTPAVGDPEWRITPNPNSFSFASGHSYRNQTEVLSMLAFLRVLGLHRTDWQPVWDYALRCDLPNHPAVGSDYPICYEESTSFGYIWAQYKAQILAVPQPELAPPPVVNPFYPDVADVNLAIEGAALKFPEGNGSQGNQDSSLLTYKGALYQPDGNLGNIPASNTAQALYAIVRLPLDKFYTNTSVGLFGPSGTGGNRFRLYFNGGKVGTSNLRNKFTAFVQGNGGGAATFNSATVTEDAVLVVVKCDGANNWAIDWYSLATGIRYAGTPLPQSTSASSGSMGSSFGIGANITDVTAYTSNVARHWPGEIEAIGMVRRAVSDTDWSDIALGADIVTVLGAGTAANLPYLKKYDSTVTALVKPALGTVDATVDPVPLAAGADPVLVPASRFLPGSTIRRQSFSTYLTIDLLSEGWVYGLVAGQVTRTVPFSGKAAGYTGNVEVRVYDASTGDVVRDWTVAGAISAGVWSGDIELPKASGWWFCEARVASNPTVKAYRRTEFAVGYKILLVGQSQLSIGSESAIATTLTHPQSFSFAETGTTAANQWPKMSRVGTSALAREADTGTYNGIHWFANQFRKFDTSTPFMLIIDAVNGTGMIDLYNDSTPSLRLWAWLQGKLDRWGTDVTVVGHQWASNESGLAGTAGTTNTSVFKERMDALFYGTGAQAGAHNLRAAMPNAVFAISPTTRDTVTGAMSLCRTQVCEWAYANGAKVGPPASDYRIESTAPTGGGPHPDSGHPMGTSVLMGRMAIAVARALGLDASTNPYFTTAAFGGGNTTITVSVALPNGGALYSPAPTDVRSFQVDNGGIGTWTGSGFTAAVVGNTVVLTKASGSWSAGTKVRYLSNLQGRAAYDGAAEEAIIAGALYETWAKDVVKPGNTSALPLLGSMSGSDWYPDWSVTVT